MTDSPLRIESGPPAGPRSQQRLFDEIASVFRGRMEIDAVLRRLLPEFRNRRGLSAIGLVAQSSTGWRVRAWCDADGCSIDPERPITIPESLIADAVDSDQSRSRDGWCAVPYQMDQVEEQTIERSPLVGCLVYQTDSLTDEHAHGDRLDHWLITAALRSEFEDRFRCRVDQLDRVSQAAANWHRTQLQESGDENTLLHQIADTATDLMNCQRASIFLWEKRRGRLVGRPALGIDGEPLVVADDAGIVGEVLASGQPQIWNGPSDDESRVNRDVDRDLDFDTRSLVAVPLIGSKGATIGVFEAINHADDCFGPADVLLLSDLAQHAAVAIETTRAKRSLTESRDRLVRDAAQRATLIGDHPSIVTIRNTGTRVAKTDLTVMITGGNGTGKEVVARHIHYESDRRGGPFMAVNCAALVESLLESELFGHEKGSFTDAGETRVGKFELASGGTLFLDEVGDMSPGGQAKLLRVLEQREVVRVGGSVPIPVDVRVIAATNQPLEAMIAEKRFREDLFFRLNVVPLALPDLADRGRDVLLLAEHFLAHFCFEIGRKVPELTESARSALLSHPWRGNVRELRNTIERVCYLTSGPQIEAADLELRPTGDTSSPASGGAQALSPDKLPHSLTESTRLFQIERIRAAIEACDGNMTEAAARLDLHRSNLYRKMKQLGMPTR